MTFQPNIKDLTRGVNENCESIIKLLVYAEKLNRKIDGLGNRVKDTERAFNQNYEALESFKEYVKSSQNKFIQITKRLEELEDNEKVKGIWKETTIWNNTSIAPRNRSKPINISTGNVVLDQGLEGNFTMDCLHSRSKEKHYSDGALSLELKD